MTTTFLYSSWRTLFDGVEVPHQDISITYSRTSQAVISIAPDKLVANLRPQTVVHIFVRKHDSTGKDESDYILFWEGFVIGTEHVKSPQSRALIVQCAGAITILEQFKAFAAEIGPLSYSSILTGSSDLPVLVQESSLSVDMPQTPALVSLTDIMSAPAENVSYADKLVSLVDRSATFNGLLRQHIVRTRLLDRIAGVPDNVVGTLLSESITARIVATLNSSMTANYSIMNIIEFYENLAFYNHSAIPAPASASRFSSVERLSKIPQVVKRYDYLVHPGMQSVLPPPCNFILNDHITSFSISRNRLVEPTRYFLIDPNNVYSGLSIITYMAPASLANTLTASDVSTNIIGSTVGGVSTDDPYELDVRGKKVNALSYFTQDELEKGMFSKISSIEGAESAQAMIARRVTSDTDSEYNREKLRIVNYQYELNRFSGMSATVVLTGHRWVIPGMSCMIFDNDIPYHGHVVSVTFSIAPTGNESTTIIMDYVRPLTSIDADFTDVQNTINLIDTKLSKGEDVGLLFEQIVSKYSMLIPPTFTSDQLIDLPKLDAFYSEVLGCSRFYSDTVEVYDNTLKPVTENLSVRRLRILREYLKGLVRINEKIGLFTHKELTAKTKDEIISRRGTTLADFLDQNALNLNNKYAFWIFRPIVSFNGWDDSIFSKLIDEKLLSGQVSSSRSVSAIRQKFGSTSILSTRTRQNAIIEYSQKHYSQRLFEGS